MSKNSSLTALLDLLQFSNNGNSSLEDLFLFVQCARAKRGKFLKVPPALMVRFSAKKFLWLKVYILLRILVFKILELVEPYGI